MPGVTPEEAAYARLFVLILGGVILADMAVIGAMLAGWARGRPLLARRWSAAHVLIAVQAWLVPTMVVAAIGTGAVTLMAPSGAAGSMEAGRLLRPVLLFAVVIQNVAMVAVVLAAVHWIYDQHVMAVGLSLRRWGPRAALGLLTAVVLVPFNSGLERLSAEVLRHAPVPSLLQRGFNLQMKQFLEMFDGTGGLLLAILVIGIIAPFAEELFFRGFAYRCFRSRWGPLVGMMASAALFSLIHMNPVGLLPIFVIGSALAYLYEKTGTLVAPFVLHAANNIVAVLLMHYGRG